MAACHCGVAARLPLLYSIIPKQAECTPLHHPSSLLTPRRTMKRPQAGWQRRLLPLQAHQTACTCMAAVAPPQPQQRPAAARSAAHPGACRAAARRLMPPAPRVDNKVWLPDAGAGMPACCRACMPPPDHSACAWAVPPAASAGRPACNLRALVMRLGTACACSFACPPSLHRTLGVAATKEQCCAARRRPDAVLPL